jgi:hypothetical protein
MAELAGRRARTPDLDHLVASVRGLDARADLGRDHVGGLQVEVVAGPDRFTGMRWMPAVPYCCRYDWSCTRVLVKEQSPLQLVGMRIQMIDASGVERTTSPDDAVDLEVLGEREFRQA